MKDKLKQLIKKLPYFQRIYAQLDALEVPPGHFYSPIPSVKEIKLKEKDIFENIPRGIPGIDLNEEYQLELFQNFKKYYDEQPFFSQKNQGLRYYFENFLYPYSDAIFLYCMMRHYRPTKIIEVGGSGYSSSLILDTNERFFNNTLSCLCIEPYTDHILSLIKEDEEDNFQLINKNVQDVDLETFQLLCKNDILFIDSTHVSKINSDVNYLLFQVIPSLQSGVLIHFHDIFYPFEYPKAWVYKGRAWNENYILRAFLQYNNGFKIEFFNTFLQYFYQDLFFAEMPLCMKGIKYDWNGGSIWYGGSIWLRKL